MNDMNNPLLSVIIPVYNVEKYIGKCLDSVLEQTYREIEVLLVDDGSTDGSGEVCDAFARRDSRVIVFHNDNCGVAHARAFGLEKAKGRYISYVDPDDYIMPEMFTEMLRLMERDDSDMAVCDVIWITGDGQVLRDASAGKEYLLTREEAMKCLLKETLLKPYVVDKIYKAEIIKSIHFDVGKIHEDVLGSYQAVGNAKSVSVSKKAYYYYVQRADSIMGVGYSAKRLDALDAVEERCAYIQREFPGLYYLSLQKYAASCMYHLQQAMLTRQDKSVSDNILARLGRFKKQPVFEELALRHKIWLKLFLVFPRFTCRVRNKLKIGF